MDIEVAEERNDEVLVLSPVGRLDSGNVRSFESVVMDHVSSGERRVVVDFSRLDFISSAGEVPPVAVPLPMLDPEPLLLPPSWVH